MPELKMYKLYNDCANVKFEFNLYRKNVNDLEWIPYKMKIIVEEETYSIGGFSLHKKMIESDWDCCAYMYNYFRGECLPLNLLKFVVREKKNE